jgi:hypothetical protein
MEWASATRRCDKTSRRHKNELVKSSLYPFKEKIPSKQGADYTGGASGFFVAVCLERY